MASNGPVEQKVKTGSATTLLTTFVLGWILSAWPTMPDALSGPLAGLVSGVIASGAAYGTMWLTRHTPRPDLKPATPERDGSALAEAAYTAYGDSTGWKTFTGTAMSPWEDLPEHIRAAWIAAAGMVRDRVSL
jgi:hypothetical protein